MEGEIRFELIKNGKSNGESSPLATHDQHPNVEWEKVWNLFYESIKAYYTNDSEGAKNAVKAILRGSDEKYLAQASIPLWLPKGTVDTIRVIFRAWSEDDLKSNTCQSIAPPQAIKVRENIQTKSYEVVYDLNTTNLPNNQKYTFTFGAQDDGWLHDVAICSVLDVVYAELPLPFPPT